MTIPTVGRQILVNRIAARAFAAFYADWQRLMPKRLSLTTGPLDAWEYREARKADGLSNHAGGVAVDVRYDILKADGKAHMSEREAKIVRKLLDVYVTPDGRRIFGWGGDWSPYVDEMHLEIAQGWAIGSGGQDITAEDVRSCIKHLRIKRDGTRPLA
jgi:hypothetical protein